MPIYEYVCKDCGKKSSFLIMKPDQSFAQTCRKCGGSSLERVMSRFATVRSEESRLESLADPSKWSDFDENDPKSMARFMKKMGKELGEDLGDDLDQMIEEAEQESNKSDESNSDFN